jgi:hypothetical protein
MPGLILHCGAAAISRNDLAALPMPESLGPRHAPRPFIDDVLLVEDELKAYGLGIVDEAYGVTHDANRFFGVVEVEPVLEGELLPFKDYRLMVGLRGSHDQSLGRGISCGSHVLCCDNLAFSGEVVIKTRQTTHIDNRMPELMRTAVARIPALAEHQAARFERYKNTKLTQRQGDAAIVELVRRDIINPSIVKKVVQEWDEPSHPEHAEFGYSVWRLHNAVTEGLKPTSKERFAIPALWQRTIPMTGFLDEVIGL